MHDIKVNPGARLVYTLLDELAYVDGTIAVSQAASPMVKAGKIIWNVIRKPNWIRESRTGSKSIHTSPPGALPAVDRARCCRSNASSSATSRRTMSSRCASSWRISACVFSFR